MITSDDLNRICIEIAMGWEWQDPRSRVPNSEEHKLSWKRLEIQMAEIAERGHFIELPFEIPG